MPNVIVLLGDPFRKEKIAAAAVTPGELLELDASAEVQPHSTAGGNAQRMFAVEEEFVGDGIDDDYADGDTVQYVVARRGDELYAFLAAGESVSEGDPLESDGAGALQAWATAADGGLHDNLIGYAAEDVDNGAGTVPARIKIEIA